MMVTVRVRLLFALALALVSLAFTAKAATPDDSSAPPPRDSPAGCAGTPN